MTMPPADAEARRAIPPVICYPTETLPKPDLALYRAALSGAEVTATTLAPPRDACSFTVPAGHFFRITSVDGPQVGDLNLWNAHDLSERFYSGKTRALHGTHVTTGDRLWSSFPTLRPLATVVEDTLDWYGIDAFGGSVHDVIGTRCDPPLLPLEPHPCPVCRLRPATGRGRAPRPRCAQCLHVHGVHPRHRAIFHEGKPGPSRRPPYLPCRDRPAGRAQCLSGRGLLIRAQLRHGRLLSAAGRGAGPGDRGSRRLAEAAAQRL